MKKRMHSIRVKVLSVTMSAIIVSVLLIGSISIFAIKSEGDTETARHMNLICDDKSKSINEFLDSVEQSIDMISYYALEDLDADELRMDGIAGADGSGNFRSDALDPAWQVRFERYLEMHVRRVETFFKSIGKHSDGVVAYYYRINPEIALGTEGFFYVRDEESNLVKTQPTDLSLYADDDIGHVGWYFIPLQNGAPTWLDPYYNENLGVEMISFVTPLFKDDVFMGVIGMDISRDALVETASSIRLFDTGYACLTTEDGVIVYHPSLQPGASMQALDPDLAVIADTVRGSDGSGEATLSYSFNGVKKKMAFNTLANGLKLIVVAPERETNASWLGLINRIILTALLILGTFALIMTATMKRITDPLKRLTEASRHLAAGDYDVKLEYDHNDEVGILTDSFRKLTEHLRVYISDLNSRAYRDALTGVKNKGAFDIFARKLDDAIRAADPEHPQVFAIVMLDCNKLKRINDTFGHDKGDIYLQTACTLICRVFAHSPVFRVGGDEFVVILRQEDFANRFNLLEKFDQCAEEINANRTFTWEGVNISKGLAVYDPLVDSDVEDVLHRADALMYREKRRQQEERR